MVFTFKLSTKYKTMKYCDILKRVKNLGPKLTLDQCEFIANKINFLKSFWYEGLETRMNIIVINELKESKQC